MSKQSSVEFAVEKLEALIPSGNQLAIYAILEQAKAMHKEEIIEANIAGMEFIPTDPNHYTEDAQEYYKEKFA